MSQFIPESQLPTCDVCKLEPLPQSTQYLPFIIIEFLLILVNFKLSLITLLIGYMICKTVWICPLCKREITVSEGKSFPTQHHIIIRMNDCMVLMSKVKFRVVATILLTFISYWYLTQPTYQYKPRVSIQKSWKSIVTNCGYDAYLENSFKFNYLYDLYEDTNNWTLEGIFLGKDQPGKVGLVNIKVKMNPTQFIDSDVEDIIVLAKNPQFDLQKGDILKFNGEWSGHRNHILIFIATSLQKTGSKIQNFSKQVQVLSHGLLRQHPN